jgi:hypothetical protein
MEKYQEVLAQVRQLERTIQDLIDRQDRLMDPVLVQILQEGNRAEAEYLIQQLPAGFHRTELQVWLAHQKEFP